MVDEKRRGRQAIFLDRDGTLIEDCGDLGDPDRIVFFPWTVEALKRLSTYFTLFIVTNQSAVAAGRLTEGQVAAVNARVVAELKQCGLEIAAVYVCPHARADNCACIKPKPYFLEIAARDFGIDLSGSYSIGDHPHDAELVRAAGGTGVYVLTGHGPEHRDGLDPRCLVFPSLLEAADAISKMERAGHETGETGFPFTR